MAQASWPSPAHNSRAVNDIEYEKIHARETDDGIYGDPTATQVVTTGAGLQVLVKAGKQGSVRGHFWQAGTTDVPLSITANASGSTRTDRVVLRLDRSAWTVRAVVRAGTPGSGAPALQQDEGDTGLYEVPLAQVTVADGASSVTVTRGEQYVGTRCRPCTSGTRPPSPARGQQVFETDTGRWMAWNGTTWATLYEDTGTVVVNSSLSAWSVGTDSVVQRRSGNVHMRLGSFVRNAGTLAAASDSRLPVLIPAAYRHPDRDQYGIVHVSGAGGGRVTIYAASNTSGRAGQVWLSQHPGVSSGGSVLGSTISWAV